VCVCVVGMCVYVCGVCMCVYVCVVCVFVCGVCVCVVCVCVCVVCVCSVCRLQLIVAHYAFWNTHNAPYRPRSVNHTGP
jgi:hypothetical protein